VLISKNDSNVNNRSYWNSIRYTVPLICKIGIFKTPINFGLERILTMVCVEQNSQNFSGLFTSSGIRKNTTFRKLDMFPSSGEGGGEDTYSAGNGSILHVETCPDFFYYKSTHNKMHCQNFSCQLGPLERANLNNWTHLHLRTETDPVSETSCFLEYRTMEKVQKNSVNSVHR
jgi:hypothetical protein